MRTKDLLTNKVERQLLMLTTGVTTDRIQIHVELLNEPYLTELCEALLWYILLGQTTHFDSRVMRGMYERAIEILDEGEAVDGVRNAGEGGQHED